MTKSMKRRACVAVVSAGLLALAGTAAFAQTSAPAAEIDDGAIITPKRSDRTPPGILAPKNAGAPDWEKVRAAIKDRRDREAAFDRQIRAMELTRVVPPAERERLRPKGLRPAAPEEFQRVSVEDVKRTRVPLLVPVTAETVSNMRIVARENAYTALGDLANGASFEILGTCMHVVGGSPADVKSRLAQRRRAVKRLDSIDASFVISRHEQGVDLSLSKFNCAYMITIYCPDPDNDPRCSSDDLVGSLADNLAILNEAEGGTP